MTLDSPWSARAEPTLGPPESPSFPSGWSMSRVTPVANHRPPLSLVAVALGLYDRSSSRSLLARIIGLNPLNTEASRAYRGALAEIAIYRTLARLGPEWTIIHALPCDTSGDSIDHLLIGPPGVFAIAVRNHPGRKLWVGERTFLVDNELYPYIAIAEIDADYVTDRMYTAVAGTPRITPVIVAVEPAELLFRRHPSTVEVVDSRRFDRWLRSLPPVLTPQAVSFLVGTAQDVTTWPAPSLSTPDAADLIARFDRLRVTVTGARVRLTALVVLASAASVILASTGLTALINR